MLVTLKLLEIVLDESSQVWARIYRAAIIDKKVRR